MFEYLIGAVTALTPIYVVLDVQGIGFLVHMANPYRLSDYQDKSVKLYVYQEVKEDSQLLYGFRTLDEKQLFLKLIKVSGIGAKSAMAILANEDYDGLITAIETDNIRYLTQFPGVGKKTAGQLILDLKGKLTDFSSDLVDNVATVNNGALSEALQALETLGYSKKDVKQVEKVLAQETEMSTDDYLRQALSLLTQAK